MIALVAKTLSNVQPFCSASGEIYSTIRPLNQFKNSEEIDTLVT
jgi:hypothetical protein